jgi:hypothetical protein
MDLAPESARRMLTSQFGNRKDDWRVEAGIRHENPRIDEERVQRILRERLALARRLEQGS